METEGNWLNEYWDWLNSIPSVARDALILEDKNATGRPDPDFRGQAVIHILKNVNTFEEFEYLMSHVDPDADTIFIWNVWLSGFKFMGEKLTGKSL